MSEELSWIERAKKLVEYHEEAQDFVRRVGKQLPTGPSDALAVSELWVEADRLDDLICSLLDEMNTGLVGGNAELDTTRGASIRPAGFEEEAVFYECSWTLQWGEHRGVLVNLAVEPSARLYEVNVHAIQAEETRSIRHPVTESELKEGLINAYVIETTRDDSVGQDSLDASLQ